MPTLIILLIFALAGFLFYRIRTFRIKAPFKKQWTLSKANIALGAFLFLFGLNRLFVRPDLLVYIVCSVFIIYGGFVIFASLRAYRYYLPLAAKEAEESYRDSLNSGQ